MNIQELKILRRLKHLNVIHLIDFHFNPEKEKIYICKFAVERFNLNPQNFEESFANVMFSYGTLRHYTSRLARRESRENASSSSDTQILHSGCSAGFEILLE